MSNPEVTNYIICALAKGSSTLFVKYDPDLTGDATRFFIKYRMRSMGEARTQEYLFHQAIADAKSPRIPQVYDAFEIDHGTHEESFIVMEFVDAPTVESWLDIYPGDAEFIYDLVAKAVDWLLKLAPPADAPLGPIGGGLLHHKAFPYDLAPLAFTSKDAVQRYFNEVRSSRLSNATYFLIKCMWCLCRSYGASLTGVRLTSPQTRSAFITRTSSPPISCTSQRPNR